MAEERNRTAAGGRRPPYRDVPAPRPSPRRPGGDPPRPVDGERFREPEPFYGDLPPRRTRGGLAALVGAVALLGLGGVAAWQAWPGSGDAAAHGAGTAARPAPPSPVPGDAGTAPQGDAARRPRRTAAVAPPRADDAAHARAARRGASAPPADRPRAGRPVPEPPVHVRKAPPAAAVPPPGRQAATGSAAPPAPALTPHEGARRGGALRDEGPGRRPKARGGERRAERPVPRYGRGGVPRSGPGRPEDRAKRAAGRRTGRGPVWAPRGGVTVGPVGDPRDPLSAAYACRRFVNDWRHPFCVRIWNEQRRRLGLD